MNEGLNLENEKIHPLQAFVEKVKTGALFAYVTL
jgi:hypothetical protein